jgi:hypothetical protein
VPTTLGGLLIFVLFLTPGVLYDTSRKRRVPLKPSSGLVEAGTLVTASLLTNLVTLCLFGIARIAFPRHTPDIAAVVRGGESYILDHLGYLVLWLVLLWLVSSFLAVIASHFSLPRPLRLAFPGHIVDSSAWYRVLNDEAYGENGEKRHVIAGLELRDGSYLSGEVTWFSTDVEETSDRGLVLAAPITFGDDDSENTITDFKRLVVSAGDIVRLWVSYYPTWPLKASEISSHPDDVSGPD